MHVMRTSGRWRRNWAAGGVRVTFVGISQFNQTMRTLDHLARHLQAFPERPTALYLGVGSWFYTEGGAHAAELLPRLERLARLVPPPAALTYGRILGMSNRYIQFDEHMPAAALARASPRWRVFERRTNLSLLISRAKPVRPGLFMTSGHAPPLVNYIDVQRLLASGALVPEPARPSLASSPARAPPADAAAAACVQPLRMHYGSWCAGIGSAARGENGFTEAYFHLCNVRLVSR